MPKIVELRQNRNLIQENFDGYKLSLDSVPIIRENLTTPPHRAHPSDDQYSFLHAELFSKHNFLVIDPWQRTSSYFINHHGHIIRSSYDRNTGSPQPIISVYEIEIGNGKRVSGDYNYSMKLISEKYCLVCDGINELLLLETGDRLKMQTWKKVTLCQISMECKNFLLYDCRLDIFNEKKIISCCLGRVKQDKSHSHKFEMHFGKLSQDPVSNAWTFTIADKLEGKGSIFYCAFEPRAEALVIASNKQLQFHSKLISELHNKEIPEESHLNEISMRVSNFGWSQTEEDVSLKFKIIKDKTLSDYFIKCSGKRLTIKCSEELLIEAELFSKVDHDLTTWTIESENNFLKVTLVKEVPSKVWLTLLADGGGPKETTENGTTEGSSFFENKPIANLEAPIEECDFPENSLEYENRIERFHLTSLESTHQICMGPSPPLFSTYIRPGFPPAIATRQNIDACLWLQQYNPSKPDEWSMRHEGNLHAFGYVQASKEQKKFMDCAPDLSYSIIVESHRHVFLYKANYDTASGLRNRSGSQITIGKQHLITLEDTGEVLGIATDVDIVTLLTEKCILYLQIN